MGGRNRFRTVHSSANWNWEPSQYVRTRSAKAGDAVPSGNRALVGARSWVEVSLVVLSCQLQARHREERTRPCSCPISSKHLTRWVVEVLNYFDEQLPFDLGKCSANVSNPISLMWISSSGRDRWLLFCSHALLCEVWDVILMSSPEWKKHFLQLTEVPRAELTSHPAPNPGSACSSPSLDGGRFPWGSSCPSRSYLSILPPQFPVDYTFHGGICVCPRIPCLKQDCFGFSLLIRAGVCLEGFPMGYFQPGISVLSIV